MKSKEMIKFANNLAYCPDMSWNIWLRIWHCWLATVREPYWVPFSNSTGILITALLCNPPCQCVKNLKSAWAPHSSDPMPVPLCYCLSITSSAAPTACHGTASCCAGNHESLTLRDPGQICFCIPPELLMQTGTIIANYFKTGSNTCNCMH